jgi:alkylhydroperoxidase/carboxymuconolactone decarboxylase family protein YurZ
MKGYEAMARRELARGQAAGLTFEEAASGAAILCSVRGEGAALRFIEVLEAEYPDRSDPDTPLTDISVGKDEARDNFLAYFESMPPSLGKLLDLVPVGADAYYLMRQGTIGGTPIGQKYAELLLVAVLAADYSPLASVHINGARTAGASETEICEAILCAVPTSGLSAWVTGANAMDA